MFGRLRSNVWRRYINNRNINQILSFIVGFETDISNTQWVATIQNSNAAVLYTGAILGLSHHYNLTQLISRFACLNLRESKCSK